MYKIRACKFISISAYCEGVAVSLKDLERSVKPELTINVELISELGPVSHHAIDEKRKYPYRVLTMANCRSYILPLR